jgi:hypothetical protein
VSGVFTNQVTKSGGNRLSGEYNVLFMNSSMQSDNVDDYILGRLGALPGTQVAAAGNPTNTRRIAQVYFRGRALDRAGMRAQLTSAAPARTN